MFFRIIFPPQENTCLFFFLWLITIFFEHFAIRFIKWIQVNGSWDREYFPNSVPPLTSVLFVGFWPCPCQQLEPQQWQHQILNPLCHQGTPAFNVIFLLFIFPSPVFLWIFSRLNGRSKWLEGKKYPFAYQDTAFPALSWSLKLSVCNMFTYYFSPEDLFLMFLALCLIPKCLSDY